MLQSIEKLSPADGRIEGTYAAHDGWIPMPIDPTTVQARFFLGDPLSGPLVWLFHSAQAAAGTEEPRPEKPPAPHLHRTPTFRIALGDQPRQMLLNNRWYGKGEYFLLDANKSYTDPNGIEGFDTLLIFADRRGMHPAMKATAGLPSGELIAFNARLFAPFGEGLSSLHVTNDQAVGGAAISARDGLDHGGQASGSLTDRAQWTALSDGSKVAVVRMGDAACGPAVIMSANAPGAVEAPAARCGADMLRVIAEGSCTIDGRLYETGAFVASAAGSPVGEVVHGPQGSTQLIVVGDRRGWAPVDDHGATIDFPRLKEIARAMAPA
jgi:hypothetical protein